MGRYCFICYNGISKVTAGPASIKIKDGRNGITKSQCVTFCKALSIPLINYQDELIKSPVCSNCCKKIQKMSRIITALESLQDTIRQFRWEVKDMMEKSHEAVTIGHQVDEEEQNEWSTLDTNKEFRKNLLDILRKRCGSGKKDTKYKKKISKSDFKSIKVEPWTENELENERRLVVKITPLDVNTISKSNTVSHATVSHATPTLRLVTYEDEENISTNIRNVLDNEEEGSSFDDRGFDENIEDDEFIVPLVSEVYTTNRKSNSPEINGELKKDKDFELTDLEEDDDDNDELDLAPPKHRFSSTPNKKRRRNEEQRYCNECDRYFKNDTVLEIHTKRKHLGIKQPFACSFDGCTRRFRQRYLWKLHEEGHTTGVNQLKKYACEICGKVYESNNSLQRHKSTHTGTWKYPCPKCDKGFHRPGELKIHIGQHDQVGSYQCNYCEEKFMTSRQRIVHHSTAHPEEDLKTSTKCEYCFKVFSGLDALRCHKIQLHQSGEFRYHCEICSKGFAKSSWLVRHKLQHSMEKTFACDMCPEKFRFPNSLATHKMKHVGNYPFKCSSCEKRFLLRTQLTIHESIHSTDRPFICEYCGKTFSLPVYLSHHTKRIHYKEMGLTERPNYYLKDSERRRAKKLNSGSPKKTKGKRTKAVKRGGGGSESSVHSMDETDQEIIDDKQIQIEVVYGEIITEEESEIIIQNQKEIDEATQRIQEIDEVDAAECIQVMDTQHIEVVGEEKIETDQFIEFVVSHE